MPRAEFENATPATKRPQTYALDRATTGIGCDIPPLSLIINKYRLSYSEVFRPSRLTIINNKDLSDKRFCSQYKSGRNQQGSYSAFTDKGECNIQFPVGTAVIGPQDIYFFLYGNT
jgi:hypothetical protein